MTYTIKSIEFYVRETGPARIASALGKKGQGQSSGERVTSPLAHVRMILEDSTGAETFGCSADRLSVRWLDKRPGREKGLKLRELIGLIQEARKQYLAHPQFDSPFEQWLGRHRSIMKTGQQANQEDLSSAFASALLERAMLDGAARLANRPLFDVLKRDGLGFAPQMVHPSLKGATLKNVLPERPLHEIAIRHTVGLYDPLTDEDLPDDAPRDGLPLTLVDNIREYGLRHFKVKISGAVEQDLARLGRIWDLLPHASEPIITLDANEAFDDPSRFIRFVKRLDDEQLGLFQHIAFIEQPLHRQIALTSKARQAIREVSRIKPVIIDESDATLQAFATAKSLGYDGTSHKNCKGVFKSLLNRALLLKWAEEGKETVLSAEDLQNLPIVPLHQSFASVAMLDIPHCERNGHHYNRGLSMLSEKDKESVARHHRDLYVRRGDEWFLDIQGGVVRCASLQCPGFGVVDQPDWDSMEDMEKWIERRYPA